MTPSRVSILINSLFWCDQPDVFNLSVEVCLVSITLFQTWELLEPLCWSSSEHNLIRLFKCNAFVFSNYLDSIFLLSFTSSYPYLLSLLFIKAIEMCFSALGRTRESSKNNHKYEDEKKSLSYIHLLHPCSLQLVFIHKSDFLTDIYTKLKLSSCYARLLLHFAQFVHAFLCFTSAFSFFRLELLLRPSYAFMELRMVVLETKTSDEGGKQVKIQGAACFEQQ